MVMGLKTIVGLDVETTTLEPKDGEIIEVAAIRYDWASGQEVARWGQLCRAAKGVPEIVQQLTGIKDDMLEDKPFFGEITADLKDFMGDDIIFAHNASFDLNWLKQHGLTITNPVWDTFPLASVAWPEAPSYNLGMLMQQLKLPLDPADGSEHRAAADVTRTWVLLQRIRQELHLPPEQKLVVQNLLVAGGLKHYASLFQFDRPAGSLTAARQQSDGKLPSLATILGKDGLLEQKLSGFSYRAQQLAMAERVLILFQQTAVGLMEAGTGLGKTYAYLLAAWKWLQEGQSRRQIIISTRTKYLQDQLMTNDFPRLTTALGHSVAVASLKGRNNYVCSRRLNQVLSEGRSNESEAWQLLKIVCWLAAGGNGDLERLNFSHQQSRVLLKRLSAEGQTCRANCRAGECVYKQARQRAETADFVVINHALLGQWAKNLEKGQRQQCFIVDEAHHLAEAVRAASRRDLTEEMMAELGQRLTRAVSPVATKTTQAQLASGRREAEEAFRQLVAASRQLHMTARSNRLLITAGQRRGSAWQRMQRLYVDFEARWQLLLGLTRGLVEKLPTDKAAIWQETQEEAELWRRHLGEFLTGNNDRLQWLDFRDQEVIWMDVARDVRPQLQPLLGGKHGVLLTSATLTTEATFGYIKETLGLIDPMEYIFSSPFDYASNMLIYVVENDLTPTNPAFDQWAANIIQELARFLVGHTLVLLTAKKSLGSLYNKLSSALYKANINLLAQGITGGRRNIVERFRQNHNAVLLGTASFWEGLDLPGENVSALVIPKLPFPPPDDPELLVTGGGFDNFAKASLPAMLLRLRQGAGRLIRTETDRGVVVLLDSRFLTADYRRAVLATLPPATIKIGKWEEALPSIQKFLGEELLAHWRKTHEQTMCA